APDGPRHGGAVADVAAHQVDAVERQVRHGSVGVLQDAHRLALFDEKPDEVRADEAGPAGHENRRRHLIPQYLPRRPSSAGSSSRHVVHQPVRMVSTNSSGSFSARISAASWWWSYSTGTNSTVRCGRASRMVYHTLVRPSFSGRPRTPTLTKWRSPDNRR